MGFPLKVHFAVDFPSKAGETPHVCKVLPMKAHVHPKAKLGTSDLRTLGLYQSVLTY